MCKLQIEMDNAKQFNERITLNMIGELNKARFQFEYAIGMKVNMIAIDQLGWVTDELKELRKQNSD